MGADVYGAVQKSAGIIAEVENERLHSLLLQFIERFRQVVGGRFVELNKPDVADLVRTGELGVE